MISFDSAQQGTDPIQGPIFHVEVTDAGTDGQIGFDDQNKVENVFAGDTFDHDHGWRHIYLRGSVKVRIYTNRHERPGSKGSNRGSLGTATTDVDTIVAVGAGVWVRVLAAKSTRRACSFQNLTTGALSVAKSNGGAPSGSGAVAAGNGVSAVLSASAVAGDGSGGSFGLTGWTGEVWVWAAVAGNVAVGSF